VPLLEDPPESPPGFTGYYFGPRRGEWCVVVYRDGQQVVGSKCREVKPAFHGVPPAGPWVKQKNPCVVAAWVMGEYDNEAVAAWARKEGE
jgi:hypothetical protein